MLLENINQVIKASPAIQIQGKMTHLQRRAWNVLLANAYNELPHKEIHSVGMVELAAKLGFDSGNQEYLKETLEALVDFTVRWNVLGKDEKDDEWGVAALLAEAKIKNGICSYAFAPTLRHKLHNPRIYSKLNLRLQNQFKGQYALILWEVCFDYFDTDRGEGETPFIPLETFKELMGIEADGYKTFKALNQTLIKPAISEINALTAYHIEVEQKRTGRSISDLKFRIERVKQLPVQESLFPEIENLPPVALELVQVGTDRNVAIDVADQQWAYIKPDKLPEPGTYTDFLEYVSEKVEIAHAASNVQNRSGFIVEAIRENYQDDRVKQARAERAEQIKKQKVDDLREAFNVQCANIIRQAVQVDPSLVEQALERIDIPLVRNRVNKYDSLAEAYKSSAVVKTQIDEVIAAEFLKDELAPVQTAYEDEKARIFGDVS